MWNLKSQTCSKKEENGGYQEVELGDKIDGVPGTKLVTSTKKPQRSIVQ